MNLLNIVTSLRSDPRHLLYPPASEKAIAETETRLGVKLPEDLRQFYMMSNGASLFRSDSESVYFIFGVEDLQRVGVRVLGEDADAVGPANWFAIVDVRDGNYIGIDIPDDGSGCAYLDIFHESFPEEKFPTVVARSIVELLENASKSPRLFWLVKSEK